MGKREAEKELAKFQTEVEAEEYIAPEKMTFAAFVEEWKEKYGAKHLELKTMESYAHMLRNHILPVFGAKKLSDVKPIHVASFLEYLEHDGARKEGKHGGLSTTSIRFIHRIVKDVFERAVEWRIIKSNPVGAVKRPKIAQKTVEVYDEQEAAQLARGIEQRTNPLENHDWLDQYCRS
jgi:integrase